MIKLTNLFNSKNKTDKYMKKYRIIISNQLNIFINELDIVIKNNKLIYQIDIYNNKLVHKY